MEMKINIDEKQIQEIVYRKLNEKVSSLIRTIGRDKEYFFTKMDLDIIKIVSEVVEKKMEQTKIKFTIENYIKRLSNETIKRYFWCEIINTFKRNHNFDFKKYFDDYFKNLLTEQPNKE